MLGKQSLVTIEGRGPCAALVGCAHAQRLVDLADPSHAHAGAEGIRVARVGHM